MSVAAWEQPPVRHARPELASTIPVLHTARLTLGAPRLEDFPLLCAIMQGVSATSLRDSDGPDANWHDFMQMSATWVLRGHGWWTARENGTAVGFVGLGFEPGDRDPELGYLLAEDARGRGLATEACRAALGCAREVLRLPSLVSYIAVTNTASRGVARKLGAARDLAAETALADAGVEVWRHWGASPLPGRQSSQEGHS